MPIYNTYLVVKCECATATTTATKTSTTTAATTSTTPALVATYRKFLNLKPTYNCRSVRQ